MYNPISLNVIRQALAWHTEAVPKRIKRTFQQKWPNGAITTIYDLAFDLNQVKAATGYGVIDMDYQLNDFVEIVNGSFAGDGHVVERRIDHEKQVAILKLYTHWEKHLSGKPRW